jgi:tetratricopeptide (TPR) repeat protein
MVDSAATRPAPTASGALAKTPLLHLLLYAQQRNLAGTIELFAPDKRSAAILFVNGEPAKVRTSEPVAYLGRVLLELGYVTEAQLDRSLADLAAQKREGKKLHGHLLVAQGLVNEVKLQAGLDEQLARKLRHVGALPGETAYAYFDGFDALHNWGGETRRGCDPMPLLWGVLREAPPWAHVKAGLARVAGSPLRLARGSQLKRLALPKAEADAAELLSARPLRESELAQAAHLDEASAQLLAYLLLVTKQVDALPATEAPRPTTPSSVRPASIRPPSSASSGKHTAAASGAPGPSSARPVARTSGTRVSVNPEVRRALSAPPPPPKDLAPELVERWREIVERAGTIDRADYFMMLEIARDSDRDEVESAFLTLAKRWHPDRLPSELAPVREFCSRVFARMGEARATLTDDEHRARYMKLLADGSGSPEMQETVARVVEAAGHFQKAEICFKRSDFAQAESLCRKAIDLDATQPDYIAMLAWLTAMKPENQAPEKTMVAIEQLTKAIKMNDRCEKAYFWRGMLLRRLGKDDLAVRDFREAMDLNPHNIDAAREVRLHTMRNGGRTSSPPARRNSPPPPQKPREPGNKSDKSLFGRMFKKP